MGPLTIIVVVIHAFAILTLGLVGFTFLLAWLSCLHSGLVVQALVVRFALVSGAGLVIRGTLLCFRALAASSTCLPFPALTRLSITANVLAVLLSSPGLLRRCGMGGTGCRRAPLLLVSHGWTQEQGHWWRKWAALGRARWQWVRGVRRPREANGWLWVGDPTTVTLHSVSLTLV